MSKGKQKAFSRTESSTSITSTSTKFRAKGHFYTTEQEVFIAQLLSDPETWKLLDGPGEANAYRRPKTDVRAGIAEKVNAEFSTAERPINLDSAQIKNKIETMKKLWKKANNTRHSTGNGDLPNETLRQRIMRICHFYYIMEDLWSRSFSLNPRKPVQLTSNLAAENEPDTGDEASIEVSDDESSVGSLPSSSGTAKASKKRGPVVIVEVIQNLSSSSAEEKEFKRKKLEIAERNVIMQEKLVEAQIRKLEAETAKEQIELEIQKVRLQVELKKLKAQQHQPTPGHCTED
ncbi:hypothetical protein B0O80DRAFT_440887 [Mortierella sp. GBAus27b]|nr:hypothetical protein B0O80DRAFT_440887 [Mortierella sp. GBAus27b]